MAWQDDLLPGSIGGLSLYVNAVQTSVGRRTTLRELPFRDTPSHEDLGRKARRFRCDAIVIGDDYLAQKERLIELFESPGPWLFTHPWMGELSVILDDSGSLDIQESHAEGGFCKLSFGLVESGEEGGARITLSSTSALKQANKQTIQAAIADAKKGLQKVNIGKVFSAASAAIGKATGAILAQKRKVVGALGLSEAQSLTDSIRNLNNTKDQLLATPDELLSGLNGLVAGVLSLITDASAADVSPYPGGDKALRAESALGVATDLSAVDTVTTPSFPGAETDPDILEAELAVSKAIRNLAVSNTIAAFSELPLESVQAASEALQALGALADQILQDEATSDDLFVAMSDLKAALDSQLASLTASLPSVQEYTPQADIPALLLAYRVYGDPTRDLEIVGRNKLGDPNFIPGGQPLELLIDV